jgi:hypothetical protein
MSILDLQAIRKRAEAATEGPWQCANTTDGPWILDAHDMIITGTCERDTDGEFIAHARQDVPALIAEVERLQKSKDWYDGELYRCMDRCSTYYDEMKRLEERCKLYESLAQEFDYYAIIEAIEEDE